MRAWLLDQLNSFYVKVLLRAGKWTILGLFFTLMVMGISFKFVLPRVVQIAKEQSNTQVVRQGNNAKVMYKDKAIPRDFSAELEAQAPVMIYENQLRSTRPSDAPDEKGRPEDGPPRPDGIDVPMKERKALLGITNQFLSHWENFGPSDTPRSYRASISPYVSPEALDDVAKRKDNIQIDAIRPGGQVGSRWMTDGYSPNTSMAVRRFDGSTAYITTVGEIVTDGPSLVMDKTRYIRSYALILERTSAGFKVRRAVAQTLVQVT